MAKKKSGRRAPRSVTPRMFGDGKVAQTPQPASSALPASPPRAGGTAPRGASAAGRAVSAPRAPVSLGAEYRYVVGDLRRLGILAAGVFTVLIVLGLFIR
ncbi:MAG: hypothetical protein FJ011_16150 [Chloroflexi bacterium]|nr:hypothetical protein [Chloroflexota bacterium]